jgi:hypothetical protein
MLKACVFGNFLFLISSHLPAGKQRAKGIFEIAALRGARATLSQVGYNFICALQALLNLRELTGNSSNRSIVFFFKKTYSKHGCRIKESTPALLKDDVGLKTNFRTYHTEYNWGHSSHWNRGILYSSPSMISSSGLQEALVKNAFNKRKGERIRLTTPPLPRRHRHPGTAGIR